MDLVATDRVRVVSILLSAGRCQWNGRADSVGIIHCRYGGELLYRRVCDGKDGGELGWGKCDLLTDKVSDGKYGRAKLRRWETLSKRGKAYPRVSHLLPAVIAVADFGKNHDLATAGPPNVAMQIFSSHTQGESRDKVEGEVRSLQPLWWVFLDVKWLRVTYKGRRFVG